jgi:hypothetical protein
VADQGAGLQTWERALAEPGAGRSPFELGELTGLGVVSVRSLLSMGSSDERAHGVGRAVGQADAVLAGVEAGRHAQGAHALGGTVLDQGDVLQLAVDEPVAAALALLADHRG